LVPQQFVTTEALGAQNDVPTIVGLNADEGSATLGYGRATIDEFDRQTREVFGNRADEFLRFYPARSDQQAAALQRTSRRELSWAALDRNAARRAKNSKQALYIYYFARAMPWPEHPEYGAFHSSELPYVFDNLRFLPHPFTPIDQSTARVMSSYWVNFVGSGDPNGTDLPLWPIYRDLHDFLVVSDEGIGAKTLIDETKLAVLRDFLNR
jgi:para-nitrobenzyl esterase